MKRTLLAIAVGWSLLNTAGLAYAESFVDLGDPSRLADHQWYSAPQYGLPDGCATGQCPMVVAPSPRLMPTLPAAMPSAALPANARSAIVRIENARGTCRALGTGSLVDSDAGQGLVLTCAHLFRDGAGTIGVTFSDGRPFGAQLARIDVAADLAALRITAPGVRPIEVAQRYPERGDPLVSCGYGTDGRLWCNRGETLGYVSTAGLRTAETLELSGAARFGDSGGPVFNSDYELVAVLFGTNGRVVDGTFCGRIRRFLAGLSPRFRPPGIAIPQHAPEPPVADVKPDAPLVDVPPAPSAPARPRVEAPTSRSPADESRLAKLEGLVSRLQDAWQGASARIDRVADAVRGVKDALPGRRDGAPRVPPQVELPAGINPVDPLAEAARPWLAAKLAAVLISFGVPGGIAGLAAGAIVYLVMRRGKRHLQTEVARLKGRLHGASADATAAESSDRSDPAIVRHHNHYVPYELTALDKAWASAHAHIGEKYPGAVPYLKMAEGVKDQLLSGNSDPTVSEGRLS